MGEQQEKKESSSLLGALKKVHSEVDYRNLRTESLHFLCPFTLRALWLAVS